MVFSPLHRMDVKGAVCAGHLIPKALLPTSRTVNTLQSVDNDFGRFNDSVLIRHVKNKISNEQDILVDFYNDDGEKVNAGRIPAKAKIDVKESGLRTGSLTLTTPKRTSQQWWIENINSCKDVKVTLQGTSLAEEARLYLSMMHSAALTMYSQFGEQYFDCENVATLCEVMLSSLTEDLLPEVIQFCLVYRGFTQAVNDLMQGNNLAKVFAATQSINPHPIWICSCGDMKLFIVALPYHSKHLTLFPMPGRNTQGWLSYIKFLGYTQLPDAKFPGNLNLGAVPYPQSRDFNAVWNYALTDAAGGRGGT